MSKLRAEIKKVRHVIRKEKNQVGYELAKQLLASPLSYRIKFSVNLITKRQYFKI